MEEQTKKRALRLLEKRDYGRDELIEKLTQKGEPPEAAETVTDRLVELRIIDDEKYAGMVARHYAAKGFGAARIRDELRRRRLPRELWDAALEDLPEPDAAVDKLLRQKLRGDIDDRDAIRRASDALRRRGFGWTEIKEAIERLNSERDY